MGRQLDADGIHFSAEQLSEVVEFPTPVGAKGLRSFLGLANYFRDHVRHYVDMERPMWDILAKHDKSKKFQWTELAEGGFLEMQVAIRDCAKLYFFKDDPDAQIILRTDASDYEYGAYLCQVVGDRKYPVLSMSKSFHGAELNCGAIYKALEKFQYLLYNQHFILETDNNYLTFLNTATSSSRVYRWELAIQRHAFNIIHVVGKLNVESCVFDNHSTKAYPLQAVATMNEIMLTDQQYTTMGKFHNSTSGHAGIERTVKGMHKTGISRPYLRELFRGYIRMCPVCQKMSYLKIPIIARRFTTTATGPMEVLNMDYEGSFPEVKYGNSYVLTIIDTFSNAIGLYDVPNLGGASCGTYVGTAHWYIWLSESDCV